MHRFKVVLGSLSLIFALILVAGCDSGDSGMEDSGGDPVPEPTVTSVSPSEGGIGTEVAIEGDNFEPDAEVEVDGVSATNVEVASENQIFANVPSNIQVQTPVSVTVLNRPDTTGTLDSAYTAIKPELSFVNSATRPSGQVGSTVILDGRAFGDIQGSAEVLFSDGAGGNVSATIEAEEDWTESFIVTTVPDGAESGPVRVETEVAVSDSIPFEVTDGASFSPSNIEWTKTTDLPTAVSGHEASFATIENESDGVDRYVYVTGGRDALGSATDQVLSGRIDQQGDITAWEDTGPLSAPRSFHASVTATPFNSRVDGEGYLYALGGTNEDGRPVPSVSKAPLNADGSVGSWSEEQPLPDSLHSVGAVVFRSAIYVAGGSTNGDQPVSTVYRAPIDTLGNVGTWEEQSALPSARTYHGFVNFGAFLYSVGGETAEVAPDDGDAQDNESKLDEVAYGRVNLRSGEVESWTVNDNSLGKARSKHSTLASGGYLFVSSGLYSAAGNGSSENTYAQIFSDGSVDEFNGATGSNTLQSEGGTNLFNQAHISYVDSDGVAHVLIIGGDDVNAPGNKQADVLFY